MTQIPDCPFMDFTPEKGEGIIYLYSFDNGEKYVGQTTQKLSNRHKQHESRGGTPKSLIVDNYIHSLSHKYCLNILYIGPESKLDEMERYWISKLNTVYPLGLNFTDGGNLHKHHNEKSKKLMSEFRFAYYEAHPNVAKAFRELMCDPQYLPKLHRPTYGKSFSDEHKMHMSEAVRRSLQENGYNMSEARKNHLSKITEANYVKIGQYDDEGNLLKAFDSIQQAADYCHIPSTHISRCARGKRKHSGGFVWRYLD